MLKDGRILRAAREVVDYGGRRCPHPSPAGPPRMRFDDVLLTAITQIRANKLRSFFTLLGIIVSVAFLVAVVAVIQGMNAYVKENIADAMIGSNTFQVRRDADQHRADPGCRLAADAAAQQDHARRRATSSQPRCPTQQAIGMHLRLSHAASDVVWRDKTLGDVLVFGVTAPYQEIQDYRFSLRRAAHRGRRPRAAARRRRRRRHHRQAVRRTQSGRQQHPRARHSGHDRRRDRVQGTRARPVVRRHGDDADHDVRVAVRPPADHDDLGEDASAADESIRQ